MSQLDLTLGSQRSSPRVLTVSEAVGAANRFLERQLGSIWVEGEVTDLSRAASGHLFFTVKDDEASLAVVIWRSTLRRIKFDIDNGQQLRIHGRLGVYERTGRFQLYADRAEPTGLGELMLQLEQLRARLAVEGLFDPDRKRTLPRWPAAIGVVTSAHGAAIHDILRGARRRCPSRILLAPAAVQGPDAPAELIAALEALARRDEIEVIIIGRGGGSVEDLWAFNDEGLARAIAACPVPVVAAVGHEVDVTIADMVADVRAATPSSAAELVVPDLGVTRDALAGLRTRLGRALDRRAANGARRLADAIHRLATAGRVAAGGERARLDDLRRRLREQHPAARLGRDRRRLDGLCGRLRGTGTALTRSARERLARQSGALSALSPLGVLERGYAVATDSAGRVVVDASAVETDDELSLRLHRGGLRTRVIGRNPDGDGDPEGG